MTYGRRYVARTTRGMGKIAMDRATHCYSQWMIAGYGIGAVCFCRLDEKDYFCANM